MRALLTALLLSLAACKSGGGSRGGYSGPPQWEGHAQNAVTVALRELSAELKRPLEYDLSKRRLTVKTTPALKVEANRGVIKSPDGRTVWGYATPGAVTMPATRALVDVLIHEIGHVIMWANGISGDHHAIAPKFFSKYSGTKGAFLP
jgi:hypothetical protein